MKVKEYILLAFGTVCLIIVAVYFLFLRGDYFRKQSVWNAEAKNAFEKALKMEVEKIGGIPMWIMSVNSIEGAQVLKDSFPGFIILDSEYGRRTYQVPKEKYEHNLVKVASKSLLLSVLLKDYPISVDTLNLHWDSLLVEKHILANTYIRYSVTDLLEQTTTVYSKDRRMQIQADSLLSLYLGARCEAEATGYISYNFWRMIGWHQWTLLFFPFVVFGIFALVYERLLSHIKKRLGRQEIIKEKIIKVHHVDVEKVTNYDLGDGVLFDSLQGVLLKDGIVVKKIAPQVCILLKAFLNTDEWSLTVVQICHEVWNNDDSLRRLHMLISRLRKALKDVVPLDVLFDGKDTYMLRKVDSIDDKREIII